MTETKIAELEKKILDLKKSKDCLQEKFDLLNNEIKQTNKLLDSLWALGKITEKELYRQKSPSISKRIALYIATKL
jgi:uncharacterized protein YlxW (UPF0749 family)